MAEGGRRLFTANSYMGSDEVFEFPCAPCDREGNIVEAINFCTDCSEYFCLTCTKDHMKFGMTASHNVMDRTKTNPAGSMKKTTSPALLPTERCPDHDDELIKLFCRDHDVVVCNTCVSIDHRSCDGIFEISNLCEDSEARQNFPQVKDEVQASLKAMKAAKKLTQKLTTVAHDEKINNLKAIDDQTERLIKHVNDMKAVAIDDVLPQNREITNMLTANLASVDESETALEKRLKKLGNAQANDYQVFVDTKLGSKEAETARQLEERIKSGNCSSKFVVDDRVDVVLNEVSSLGNVKVNKPLKAVLIGTYDVEMKDHNFASDICDMYELPGGYTLMTDYNNECIKKVDTSYTVIKSFKMPKPAWGICHPRLNEIAVTLTTEKKVQFVDICGKWKLTTAFHVDDHCRGIAFSTGELLVSCGGHPGNSNWDSEGSGFVGIYDLSGSLRRKIQMDPHGRPILTTPRHIATSSNGIIIHVADEDKGVISMDRKGNVKSSFKCEYTQERVLHFIRKKKKNASIKMVSGVCVVDNNNLIVCGRKSNNVVQITAGGELVAELLNKKDEIEEPWAVFYSHRNNTLIVTFKKSNKIKVFNLL